MPMPARPLASPVARALRPSARWVTLVPAVLAALWFLLIGVHALVTGEHYGPLGRAPWAEALGDAGVGTRLVGAALTAWGLGWCGAVYALVAERRWLWPLALTLGCLSLWQEPVGTLLGLYVLGALALFKRELRDWPLRGSRGRSPAPRVQPLRRR